MRSIISSEAEATEERAEITTNKSFQCSEEEEHKFIIIGFYGTCSTKWEYWLFLIIITRIGFLHSIEAALHTSKLSGWMNKGGEIVEERNFGCDTNIESGWLHFVLQSLLLGEHEKAFN